MRRGARAKAWTIRRQPVALAALMVLAFLFQSYVSQTHIHLEADGITLAKVQLVTKLDSKKGAPTQQTPDNCPLCQFYYVGQHVPPAALIFFLPTVSVSVIEAVLAVLPHYDAASHSWRGRAPPQD
jgi:hypothetical protein